MATEGPLMHDGGQCTANSDLSAKQFCAVKMTGTARAVDLASTGGEAIYGILQNTPTAGQAADIGIAGVSKAQIGTGGCTPGQQLMTEASTGKLIVKTSTNAVVAVALETNAAGDVGTVRIVPGQG